MFVFVFFFQSFKKFSLQFPILAKPQSSFQNMMRKQSRPALLQRFREGNPDPKQKRKKQRDNAPEEQVQEDEENSSLRL
jgi:hypothetical protein